MTFIARFILPILLMLALPACRTSSDDPDNSGLKAASAIYTLSQAVHEPVDFVENSSYLSMNVAFEPIEDLQEKVATKTGLKLKGRGEAHITVLTPAEFTSLSRFLSRNEINDIARAVNIQSSEFSAICVGSGSVVASGRTDRTFYVVVKAPKLIAIRQTVLDEFKRQGGTKMPFASAKYYPHITIGFTKTDLFEEQGVIKDETSCIGKIVESN